MFSNHRIFYRYKTWSGEMRTFTYIYRQCKPSLYSQVVVRRWDVNDECLKKLEDSDEVPLIHP